MFHPPRRTALLLAAVLCTWTAPLALADPPNGEPIRDRTNFIPHRKQQQLPGKVIGVLVYDAQPVLSSEGRSGPTDQLCFGLNGCSYRWVYVPTPGVKPPVIGNLQVPVGDKGAKAIYPALDMARPKTVKHWGVTAAYSLVEVEVNDGKGSPPNDSFVATNIKVLDGTPNYPIKTNEVVEDLKKRYATYLQEQANAIERQLDEAGKKALKDRKVTGPREKSELMFVTWVAETQRLRVHFRTRVSDGTYQIIKGGPGPKQKGPPRVIQWKVGTTFGVEFGMAYEVGRDGRLVAQQALPFEAFQQEVRTPGGIGQRNPLPLPPPKK